MKSHFFKPIIISTDDMDKFEENKFKKKEILQKTVGMIVLCG